MQKEKVKVEADLKLWSVIEGRRRKVERAMWDMVENARPPGMSVADYKVSLLFFMRGCRCADCVNRRSWVLRNEVDGPMVRREEE